MNQLGYYGKVPHRGDFVRYNLPQTFLNVWDDWLQQILLGGEQQYAEWADLYSTAPSWNFVLSSGVAGNASWIGTMRPSNDKVGRRFPFCLAMSLSDDALACSSVTSYSAWFNKASLLLDRALVHNYQFNNLKHDLAILADNSQRIGSDSAAPSLTSDTPLNDTMTVCMDSETALNSAPALTVLLDTILMQTIGEYSIWISDTNKGNTIITAGLPVASTGLSLFNVVRGHGCTTQLGACNTVSESASNPQTTHINNTGVGSYNTDSSSKSNDTTRRRLKRSGAETQNTANERTPPFVDLGNSEGYADTHQDYLDVPAPKVEPLVLDDEDLPDAPWEK